MILADHQTQTPALTYLKIAARHAMHSEHGIYRMGAIVIRKGRIIAYGFNKNRTHPRALNFTRKIHAELAALIMADRGDTYNSDMYIVRITNGGRLATSKPCRDCEILLKEAGIKSVTYIDKEGLICTQKL